MTRAPLPDRRQHEIREVVFAGQPYQICVGTYPDGKPGEVFADGPRHGSDMQWVVSDACVLISIALQHGITPEALAHSLAKVPAFHGGEPVETHASAIGAIVGALL